MNGELKKFPSEAWGRLIIELLERRAASASVVDRRCLHRACRILMNQVDPRDSGTDAATQTEAPFARPTTSSVSSNVKREHSAPRQPKLEAANANANANANQIPLVAPVKDEQQRVPTQESLNLDGVLFNGCELVGDGQRPRSIPLEPTCAGLEDPRCRNRANGYGAVKEEARAGGGEMVAVRSEGYANDDLDDVEIVAEVVKILKPVGAGARAERLEKTTGVVKSEMDIDCQRRGDASSSSSSSHRMENSPVAAAAARQAQITLESIASPEDNTDLVDMDISKTPPEPARPPIPIAVAPRMPATRVFNPFVKRE